LHPAGAFAAFAYVLERQFALAATSGTLGRRVIHADETIPTAAYAHILERCFSFSVAASALNLCSSHLSLLFLEFDLAERSELTLWPEFNQALPDESSY
jgi:hypothetical protein